MTASRPACLLRSRPHGARARSLAVAMALAPALTAQTPTLLPGFELTAAFAELAQPAQVRCTLQWQDKDHLVAIGAQLFRCGAQRDPTLPPLLDLGAGEDIAFVARLPGDLLAIGALRGGKVLVLDPDHGTVGTWTGVANTYAAVAVGNDLFVNANPLWPLSGAHAGLWLVGPGRTPREVLPLVGPSAPLAVRPNGDLAVGELGPTVPPPPGAARVLRIAAVRVAAALGGATLSMADVSGIGSGWSSLFGLAVDDLDRLHASDAGGSAVVHSDPGGLTPTGVTVDVGAGRFVLGLQYLPTASAPFRGYQPEDRAPQLAIASSDFATSFTWQLLRARRPRTTLPSGGSGVAAGPFAVTLDDAPANGLACAWAAPAPSGPEIVVGQLGGTPLWLGLPLATAFLVTASATDAAGAASLAMHNPGGATADFDLQILALDPAHLDVGTTAPLHLHLLP